MVLPENTRIAHLKIGTWMPMTRILDVWQIKICWRVARLAEQLENQLWVFKLAPSCAYGSDSRRETCKASTHATDRAQTKRQTVADHFYDGVTLLISHEFLEEEGAWLPGELNNLALPLVLH